MCFALMGTAIGGTALGGAARGLARLGGASVVLVLAAGAAAQAQTRADARLDARPDAHLDAHYVATLSGLPVGEGNWTVDLSADRLVAAATGGTTGLLKMFVAGEGASKSTAVVAGGRIVSSSYKSTIQTRKNTDEVTLTINAGTVKDHRVMPAIDDDPERIPITDAEKKGVSDPMSASLVTLAGTDSLLAPEACQREVPIFDGRFRYNLKFTFKRMDTVRADAGYAGPAVVCSVFFAPIAGFIPSRTAVKYLVAMRDAEFWYVPIAGTRTLAPFRVELPTPVGVAALEATRFVASPQPTRASANVPKSN